VERVGILFVMEGDKKVKAAAGVKKWLQKIKAIYYSMKSNCVKQRIDFYGSVCTKKQLKIKKG